MNVHWQLAEHYENISELASVIVGTVTNSPRFESFFIILHFFSRSLNVHVYLDFFF